MRTKVHAHSRTTVPVLSIIIKARPFPIGSPRPIFEFAPSVLGNSDQCCIHPVCMHYYTCCKACLHGYATLVRITQNSGDSFGNRLRGIDRERPGLNNDTNHGHRCPAVSVPFGTHTSSESTIGRFWYILACISVTA